MYKSEIIRIPRMKDERGTLSFVEINKHLFFKIKEIYKITDLNKKTLFENHLSENVCCFFIAISGEILISNVESTINNVLKNPWDGLATSGYREFKISSSSPNPICLILSNSTIKV